MSALAAAAPQPDAGVVYLQTVRFIFSRWTLLRLAVDQGWGDRDCAADANEVVEHVVSLVAPQCHKPPHEEDLEDYLHVALEEKFNTNAEDGSVEEIVKRIVELRNECARGDLAGCAAILAQAPSDLSACLDRGEPEDLEGDDAAGVVPAAQAPPAPRVPPPAPVVDDDGFETVVRRR